MAKSRDTKDKHFIKRPVYEGGLKAMRKFIQENMRYPKHAIKEKIEGSVYVKYTVDHKGTVISTKIVSGLGYGCDEEAMRLVKGFKFQIGKNRKRRILFHKSIRIHFKIPKTAPKPKAKPKKSSPVKITYTTTSKKKPAKPTTKTPPKKGGGSYSYTIKF